MKFYYGKEKKSDTWSQKNTTHFITAFQHPYELLALSAAAVEYSSYICEKVKTSPPTSVVDMTQNNPMKRR